MITTKGYVQQSSSDVLANVQAAYKNTFGDGFILSPASVNGQWIQYNTLNAVQVENAKTLLFGSVYNPYLASGIWLDSICKFNNINRKPATSSAVVVVCTGLAGTIITPNSTILNTNGDAFINTDPIIISGSGTGTGIFYSAVKGEIPCNASTVNQIATQISGWDTVNNPTDGTVGQLDEADQSLRNRRSGSLAINSAGGLNSIISALNELTGVINFTVQENYTAIPKPIYGVTVQPYTVYVAVYTLDDLDNAIAKILYTKRYCGMQGNTTYTYQDIQYPWVTFDAVWQTPAVAELQVNITLPNQQSYPPNIVDLIKQSVVDNFYGLQPPIPKYKMTETIDYSRFFYSLNLVGVVIVTSITVGIVGGSMGQSVNVNMDTVLQLSTNNVVVTVV